MYFKGNHTVNGLSNIPCLPSGFIDSPSSASTPQFRLFYGPWTILPGDPTGDPALEICQGRSEASPIVLTLSFAPLRILSQNGTGSREEGWSRGIACSIAKPGDTLAREGLLGCFARGQKPGEMHPRGPYSDCGGSALPNFPVTVLPR